MIEPPVQQILQFGYTRNLRPDVTGLGDRPSIVFKAKFIRLRPEQSCTAAKLFIDATHAA